MVSEIKPVINSNDRLSKPKVPVWIWAFVSVVAAGGLMATCYWPLNWHFVAWIALVPWLIFFTKLKPGKVWLLGTLFMSMQAL